MDQYKEAGVDIAAGNELVHRIKKIAKQTRTRKNENEIGNFSGTYQLGSKSILASTDGVGTKLMIAQEAQVYDSIGIDCVAMCANDILAQGAQPLFFLDYLAVGQNNPEKLEKIVKGVADGCIDAEMELIGGETAEMPDMYDKDEFDIAGFTVGICETNDLLTNKLPQEGDILIGLPSNGLHSNGYSLVRKILFKDHHYSLDDKLEILNNESLKDELLKPTKIYVKAVKKLLESKLIHGIAHITGGGLLENVPRMLNEKLQAVIDTDAWEPNPIFKLLKEEGKLDDANCYRIFNMGIGLVLCVDPNNYPKVCSQLESENETYFKIGKLEARASGDSAIKLLKGGKNIQ